MTRDPMTVRDYLITAAVAVVVLAGLIAVCANEARENNHASLPDTADAPTRCSRLRAAAPRVFSHGPARITGRTNHRPAERRGLWIYDPPAYDYRPVEAVIDYIERGDNPPTGERMNDLYLVALTAMPGNGTRYDLIIGVDYGQGRVAVCWPETGTAGWFPLYDCVATYVQSKLRVPFGDATAIRRVLIDQQIWKEDEV